MVSSFGKRVNASLFDAVHRARLGKVGDPAVLKCSGRGGTPLTDQRETDLRALVERGITVLHGTWNSVSHWGNDSAQAEALAGITFIQAAPWSARAGKVGLIGGSMGGLLSLLLALDNPTLIFGVAVGIPAVSPIDIHDNNRAGYAAQIETAYGGLAGWNAAKAAHDPVARAAEFQALDILVKVWYTANDNICVPAKAEEFIEESGCESVNMGTLTTGPVGYEGHTVYPAYATEAADFLAQAAWADA